MPSRAWGTVRSVPAAGLDASLLARILRRPAEHRCACPSASQEIDQGDQPDNDHDPAGNPCESNHGPPNEVSLSVTAHMKAAWKPRVDGMEAKRPRPA